MELHGAEGASCGAPFCFSAGGIPYGDSGSEFARPLFRPALYDHFFVGEEFNGVATLGVHYTEEAALPTGEREVSHGCGDADIDADIAGRNGVAEFASRGTGGSED
jgi:hypothetical protein